MVKVSYRNIVVFHRISIEITCKLNHSGKHLKYLQVTITYINVLFIIVEINNDFTIFHVLLILFLFLRNLC